MPRVSSSIRPGAAVAVAARTPRSAAATAARRSARRTSLTVLKIFAVARRTATAWGCSTGSCSTRASTARHVSRSLGSISVTRRATVEDRPRAGTMHRMGGSDDGLTPLERELLAKLSDTYVRSSTYVGRDEHAWE